MIYSSQVGELIVLSRHPQFFEGHQLTSRLEYAFEDTSQWTGLRVAENLPTFLESHCSAARHPSKLGVASKALGAPHTIVVASSGMRAANLTRFVICF